MPDGQTFIERQRDAALAEVRRMSVRNSQLAELVAAGRRSHMTEVVVIEDGDGVMTGAFVVAVEDRNQTTWQAVTDGKRLTMGWYSRQLAILHLLSVRYGDGDQTGAGAQYAARVLGIKDNED